MSNPFQNRVLSLNGPASDIIPVTPSDVVNFDDVAVALYVETGGTVSFVTAADTTRSVTIADNAFLPVGAKRVNATGTDASGIHALVIS